ncbi:MAG: PHB depolymerase family esterase [Parvularculaceae bacterium]
MRSVMVGHRFWRVLCLTVFVGGLVSLSACGAGAMRREARAERRAERDGSAPQESAASATAAGLTRVELNVGGDNRYYLIYVPRSYKPGAPTPLVMVFHGGGANAEKMAGQTGFSALAEREGFIVAFPNGSPMRLKGSASWNTESGQFKDRSEKSGVDDVGFVRAALSRIKRDYNIDSRRVYATGMSKGGMFAYTLACRMSDEIAAIAAFSATMTIARCEPTQPVAILHVHGTADRTVPLDGGKGDLTAGGNNYPPVARGIDFWKSRDRCTAQEDVTKDGPETTCYAYRSCVRDVKLCLIEGHGHGWPGKPAVKWQRQMKVNVSQTFDGTGEAWEYFETHPKP